MPYLLDTDFLIDYIKDVPAAIELFLSLSDEAIAISTITYMEAYDGTFASDDPLIGQQKLNRLLAGVGLLAFDRRAALAGAELRHLLRSRGARVNRRANDLNVAATALANNLTLVTRNVRDYADTGVQILPYT